ncbi:TRAP transporter small permease subunit [bacterium]|nr:TRAP transporter small permease subunit [bacterium]
MERNTEHLSSPISLFLRGVSLLTSGAFHIALFLLPLLVTLTTIQVMLRFFFDINFVSLQELQWHLFGFIILLSMAHTLECGRQVRVDIFTPSFSQRTVRWIHIGTYLLFLPLGAILTSYGIVDVLHARSYEIAGPTHPLTAAMLTEDFPLFPLFSQMEELLYQTLFAGEVSSDAGGLGARWIIRAAFPVGVFLLTLQILSLLLREILSGAAPRGVRNV